MVEWRYESDFDIRVFNTNPTAPEDGHTYVWAETRWYDRVEDPGGAVAFSHIADDEEDLREMLLERGQELSEIDDDFAEQVRQEFSEIMPMDMDTEDRSDAPPFEEQEVSDEEEAA